MEKNLVPTLGAEASELAEEREEYMQAKIDKEAAENAVLETIIDAVRPALPAIASKVEGTAGVARGVNLGGGIYVSEEGNLFEVIEKIKSKGTLRVLGPKEVLDRTSLSAILAVLLASVRSQLRTFDARTDQIRRECSILEGISAAFKAGKIR